MIIYIYIHIYNDIYLYTLWIQPFLLRKWDWGIIYYNFSRVSRTFSDSGHGSIGSDIIMGIWDSIKKHVGLTFRNMVI